MKKYLYLASLALALTGCTLEDSKECKDGETRCVGEDTVNTCIDGNWWGYVQCQRQKCDVIDNVAQCVPICTPGDTRCEGNTLLECSDAYLWPDKQAGTPCEEGASCMSVSSFSFCANPAHSSEVVTILKAHNLGCTDDLLLCGDNNTLYSCAADELQIKQECGTQICGKSDSGVLACLNECEDGETLCEGNNLRTCTNHVYGELVACKEGTVCTLDKDGISACIERKSSFQLCSADKCIGNTLYHCKDGIYDTGNDCGEHASCGITRQGTYACLADPVCQPGCEEDNTVSLQCPGDGTTIRTICPFGCDPERGACLACENTCSLVDGEYIAYECSDSALRIQKTCQYGCDGTQCAPVPVCGDGGNAPRCYDETTAILCYDKTPLLVHCMECVGNGVCVMSDNDDDGDGVINRSDACPWNGAESTDATKCDDLVTVNEYSYSFYHLYHARNLAGLPAFLEEHKDNLHTVRLEFENDINLGDLPDVIISDGKCRIPEKYTGLASGEAALSGYGHRLYAKHGDLICTIPKEMFDSTYAREYWNLTVDLTIE